MSQHARLSPSNHRWPNCPGSIREEANYPDISGVASVDGTGSHLLLEMCLGNNVKASSYLGETIGEGHSDSQLGWFVDQDRVDRVQMALDYITRRVRELKELFPGCEVVVESESRSDPGEIYHRDDWWGTCDITIVAKAPGTRRVFFIEAADYKDGRLFVSAENNTQLIGYLSGKMSPYVYKDMGRIMDASMINGCRMTIIQPKTTPVVRYWEPTPQEVAEEHFKLTLAADATDKPDAPLKAGKWCRWCKHKGNCSQQTNQSLEKIKPMVNKITTTAGSSLFEIIESTFGDITTLDNERLADLADAEAGVMAVFDKVKKEIETRIVDNAMHVPGYAMKPGNNKQVWAADEEEIVKALKGRRLKKDDIYPSKLISPAEMMKSDKLTDKQKNDLKKKLISVVAGKMTLKKVARDEQPQQSAVDMFGETAVQSEPEQQLSFF